MDILTFTVEEKNREEILSNISRKLYEMGYVKETYEKALLEREEQYPTGILISEKVSVALPHADIEHVNKEALVIIKPQHRVSFRRMDEPKEETNVNVIFLLVIKDPKGYVKFLAKLTVMFKDKRFLEIIEKGDVEEVKKFIEEKGLLELRQQ
mgnify:CR=1 FL=1